MREKRKPGNQRESAQGPSIWDSWSGPGADEGAATVAHGPYSERLPVADMTVEQIRSRFRDRFDIDPGSLPFLDGEPADEQTTVRAGQTLMFTRRAGEKGAR